MTTSLSEKISTLAERLATSLRSLLSQSQVSRRFTSDRTLTVITPFPFGWSPLTATARPLQNTARDLLGQFTVLVDAALSNQPPSVHKEIDRRSSFVLQVIEQNSATEHETVERHEQRALEGLTWIVQLVQERAAGNPAETLIIPDTNALYAWTDLDKWHFADCARFAVVLVPAVIGEIDLHKDDRRKKVESRRLKAEKHVRQIKEYRRRAEQAGCRLADGVTLRGGTSRIMSWGREPDMTRALSWLDPQRADDRLLASAIEIASAHALSPVAILTRDVNFQNKCDLARVSLVSDPTII